MVVLPGTQLSLLASGGAIDRLGSYGSAGAPRPLVALEEVVFLVLVALELVAALEVELELDLDLDQEVPPELATAEAIYGSLKCTRPY